MSVYRRLKPALDYIKLHYMEPITLDDIAKLLKLSYSRTYHLFKEATGRTFKEYVGFLRLQQAKRLLAETDLTVTEVMLQCGYQSHTPFYRAFGREVGLSPQAYRQQAGAPG